MHRSFSQNTQKAYFICVTSVRYIRITSVRNLRGRGISRFFQIFLYIWHLIPGQLRFRTDVTQKLQRNYVYALRWRELIPARFMYVGFEPDEIVGTM